MSNGRELSKFFAKAEEQTPWLFDVDVPILEPPANSPCWINESVTIPKEQIEKTMQEIKKSTNPETYSGMLIQFCGDKSLANYWWDKHHKEDVG